MSTQDWYLDLFRVPTEDDAPPPRFQAPHRPALHRPGLPSHDPAGAAVRDCLDVLFISELPLWPLDQGYRVHGYNMARALSDLGVTVGIACIHPNSVNAAAPLRRMEVAWPQATPQQIERFEQNWTGPAAGLRRRLAHHQALSSQTMAGVLGLVERYNPAAVIALGQHGPLLLSGLPAGRAKGGTWPGPSRIWYAADELIGFQLSCLRREPRHAWRSRLRQLAVCAGIEWLFARRLDGAIAVSPRDRSLLEHLAGIHHCVTIRNGVDPAWLDNNDQGAQVTRPTPRSIIFWGRMDFEPNIDAVRWFARHVWPALRAQAAGATWQIVGKKPAQCVQDLAQIPGVSVLGAVDDIRPLARQAAAVVLPLRCGAGIKNKLLEAAALGRPILASPQAVDGLEFDQTLRPAHVCTTPQDWIHNTRRVWSDTAFATRLGQSARSWVQTHHRWPDAARNLLNWLDHLTAGACTKPAIAAEFDANPDAVAHADVDVDVEVETPVDAEPAVLARLDSNRLHPRAA